MNSSFHFRQVSIRVCRMISRGWCGCSRLLCKNRNIESLCDYTRASSYEWPIRIVWTACMTDSFTFSAQKTYFLVWQSKIAFGSISPSSTYNHLNTHIYKKQDFLVSYRHPSSFIFAFQCRQVVFYLLNRYDLQPSFSPEFTFPAQHNQKEATIWIYGQVYMPWQCATQKCIYYLFALPGFTNMYVVFICTAQLFARLCSQKFDSTCFLYAQRASFACMYLPRVATVKCFATQWWMKNHIFL